MAVEPELRVGQQIVQCVAKTRGARRQPVARVGAQQAGGKVGNGDRGAVKRLGQCGTQPILAYQGLFTQAFGQPGFASSCREGFAQIVVGGPKGFVPGLELLGQWVGLGRSVSSFG